MNNEVPVDTLAETENYVAWISEDPDGELTYHLELNNVTLHFFREEWDELLKLIEQAQGGASS
ncbi:MAG TPA: hypothetical protein VHL11_18310 [Phototrophicaceae bacterium]|jgi:hypothetical protein|nr:hypothetical protein [Phototrophicaceae bacterium]